MVKRFRRRKIGVPKIESAYNESVLHAAVEDLRNNRLKMKRWRANDDVSIGLQFVVSKSGLISFHSQYQVGDYRGLLKIGELNKGSEEYISLKTARELQDTIRHLADQGIDVESGGRRRLIKELIEQGTRWPIGGKRPVVK